LPKGRPIRKLTESLRLSELRPKESTDQSYDEGKLLESVSVALGHEIKREVIRLLIVSGGRD
jgi:hypothetical protein